jgi:hypothetical protein
MLDENFDARLSQGLGVARCDSYAAFPRERFAWSSKYGGQTVPPDDFNVHIMTTAARTLPIAAAR